MADITLQDFQQRQFKEMLIHSEMSMSLDDITGRILEELKNNKPIPPERMRRFMDKYFDYREKTNAIIDSYANAVGQIAKQS